MVITVSCTACAASFPVDPNKIPEGGVKVRCSECSNIFRVERPASEPVAAEESAREEPGSADDSMPDWAEAAGDADDEPDAGPVSEADAGDAWDGDLEPTGWADPDPSEWVDPGHAEGAAPDRAPEPTGWADAEAEPDSWGDLPTDEQFGAEDPLPVDLGAVDEPESATDAAPAESPADAAPYDDAAARPASEPEPQPDAPVQGFSFGKRDPMDKARRLARVLVSDMVMYNAERHQHALANGSLAQDFEEEIDKSWKEFVDQVGPEIAEGQGRDFWTQALNDILAKGARVF